MPGIFDPNPVTIGGPSTTDGPIFVAGADLNGDGDVDLVSANGNGSTLAVFFQGFSGNFGPNPFVLGGFGTTDFLSSVTVADLDEDGDQDLASANGAGNNVTVFFQSLPGTFDPDPLVLGADSPESVAAADLDGDGDQDLVLTIFSQDGRSSLAVYFQLSRGVFGATPYLLGSIETLGELRSVAPSDLDGDGDQDLVSANFTGNNLAVFWGGR